MKSLRSLPLLTASLLLLLFPAAVHCWGIDGHYTTCKIAQGRLTQAAANAVNHLLPKYAEGDLASLCSWADNVRFQYQWSTALHYINTPDNLCTYQYKNNLLTEALLFLSHLMGDIHQDSLRSTDRGGNTINVHWFTRKALLHHVWDVSITETAEERFYDSNVDTLVNAIQTNIKKEWADHVQKWERCPRKQTTCPNIYASEGIKAACEWAYKKELGMIQFLETTTFCLVCLLSTGGWLKAVLDWQQH